MLNKQQDISVELLNLYLLILERGRGGGERTLIFVVPLIYALVDSCMCPYWGSNLQSWIFGLCPNQLCYLARALWNFQDHFQVC